MSLFASVELGSNPTASLGLTKEALGWQVEQIRLCFEGVLLSCHELELEQVSSFSLLGAHSRPEYVYVEVVGGLERGIG